MKPWPGGVVTLATDITERLNYRDKLVSDHAIDFSLAEIEGLGTATVRDSGTIITVSAGLSRMLGAPAEALIGAKFQQLLSPSSRSELERAFKITQTRAQSYTVEYLRGGTELRAARLIATAYWTSEHRACIALALYENPHPVSKTAT